MKNLIKIWKWGPYMESCSIWICHWDLYSAMFDLQTLRVCKSQHFVFVFANEPHTDFISPVHELVLRLAVWGNMRKIWSVSQRICPSCGCSGLSGSPSRPRWAPRQTGTGGCLRCHRRGDGLVCSCTWAWPFHRGANQKVAWLTSFSRLNSYRKTLLVFSFKGEKKQLTVRNTPLSWCRPLFTQDTMKYLGFREMKTFCRWLL